MRYSARTTLFALICGMACAATNAIAQTSGSSPNAGPSSSTVGGATTTATTMNDQINLTGDQAAAFLKNFENLITQSLPGFVPAAGSSVPQDMKLHPMPAEAGAALPSAKDHHVAKTDDDTIVLVDPITRQVVGVITNGSAGSATKPAQSK